MLISIFWLLEYLFFTKYYLNFPIIQVNKLLLYIFNSFIISKEDGLDLEKLFYLQFKNH